MQRCCGQLLIAVASSLLLNSSSANGLDAAPSRGPFRTEHHNVHVGGFVSGILQTADIYFPAGVNTSFPVITFAHGVFEGGPVVDGEFSDLLSQVASHGYFVVAMDTCAEVPRPSSCGCCCYPLMWTACSLQILRGAAAACCGQDCLLELFAVDQVTTTAVHWLRPVGDPAAWQPPFYRAILQGMLLITAQLHAVDIVKKNQNPVRTSRLAQGPRIYKHYQTLIGELFN